MGSPDGNPARSAGAAEVLVDLNVGWVTRWVNEEATAVKRGDVGTAISEWNPHEDSKPDGECCEVLFEPSRRCPVPPWPDSRR